MCVILLTYAVKANVWLRRWNRNAVSGNALGLVRKDFTTAGINEDFDPLHVIRAIRLIIAKGLNPRKLWIGWLVPCITTRLHGPYPPGRGG